MNIAHTYAKVRAKVSGDNKAPWYTRWVWWLVIAGAFFAVVFVWWLAKRREGTTRAQARVAQDQAEKARLDVLEEKDQQKAAELEQRAKEAEARAAELAKRVEESAKERQLVENAIKGATSFEELDAIEKELE